MNGIRDAWEEKLPINFRNIEGSILYRSSGPTSQNLDALKSRNIKTIVDLRGESEVKIGKELADHYTVYSQIADGKGGVTKPRLLSSSEQQSSDGKPDGNHIVIPFVVNRDMVFKTPGVAFHVKLVVILMSIYDKIFGTGHAKSYAISTIVNRDGEGSLLALYKFLFDNARPQLCAALKLLSRQERVPAVVCCSLGKDRTGVLCAVLGHICGRTKEQLTQDYALSQEYYDKHPNSNSLLKGVDAINLHPVYKRAPPSAMSGALDYVDEKYGSMDAYLDGIGFGDEERCNLRKNIQKNTNNH